jgi:acetyl esterase
MTSSDAVRPPLDEGFAPILAMLADPNARPMSSLTPTEARESFLLLNGLAGPPVDGVHTEDRTIAGPGGDLPIRIVMPDGDDAPTGVLVWFHGGGWVIGDLSTADDTTRRLAIAAGCVVVSVDYRLAPEHPAPAAVEDCRAAFDWVLANRAELGAPDGRVAVGGDSAGGNLAAVVAQQAAADGLPLAAQLLVYPAVDFDQDRPSMIANGDGYFLTADTMQWFAEQYLSGGASPEDPALAPLLAADDALRGVAPAIVHVAGYDPLHDAGLAYADRLAGLGVEVDARDYPTMIHGFYSMPALTPVAVEAIDAAAQTLRRHFAG